MAATAPAIPERPTALMIRTQGRARALLAMTRPTQIALIVMVFANVVAMVGLAALTTATLTLSLALDEGLS